jgi:serine/threonine protein kinase
MKEKYELLEKIDEDTFGIVYKAKLKNADELRAIKIINKQSMIDIGEDFFQDVMLKSFDNMTICCLNNINSVKLHEYSITDKELIIATELMDENLEKFLRKRDQGLSAQEILEILTQLNNTFKIMVNNLIVHRDIKLQNIFIKYKNIEKIEYIVKLGNYEVSTRLNSLDQKMDLNVGTRAYMAPEILKDDYYDGKCDLWNLGVTIYLCLFKEFPTRLAYYNVVEIKEPLKSSGNELLDDLIKKLLVKDPTNRITWEKYFEHPFFQ